MSTTPEQQAIQTFLSKPAPYGSACGCLGPQLIDHSVESNHHYIVKTVNVPDRLAAMKVIRQYCKLSLQDTRTALEANRFKFDYDLQVKTFTKALAETGCTTEVESVGNSRYPVCPCAMLYVSEVEGRFYRVDEHRSPDGIAHTATDLGPVGGPYKNVSGY